MLLAPVYEITFEGRAGVVLRAEFDDCQVSLGQEFGLKLIELRLLTVPSPDRSIGQGSPAR